MISLSDIGLTSIGKAIDLLRSGRSESLIDYTRPTRVEPIVLIDRECVHMEVMTDIMQSLQSIFAGYYLQAVAINNVVGNVEISRQLDKLNPNRDAVDSALNTGAWMMSQESYAKGLPGMALEAFGDTEENAVTMSPVGDKSSSVSEVKELANLSVGKLLTVEICNNDQKAVIPVAIRLMANAVATKSLIQMLSSDTQANTVKERYHGFKSGRLAFIRDIVMCQDLIDAHRAKLLADNDGLLANVLDRKRGNQVAAVVSLSPSVATASNMIIMDYKTAEAIENNSNGRFKDFKFRQGVFKETSVMLCVIVLSDIDRVIIYHRGIPEETNLKFSDIKAMGKNGKSDITEIIKAYSLGQAPRF